MYIHFTAFFHAPSLFCLLLFFLKLQALRGQRRAPMIVLVQVGHGREAKVVTSVRITKVSQLAILAKVMLEFLD